MHQKSGLTDVFLHRYVQNKKKQCYEFSWKKLLFSYPSVGENESTEGVTEEGLAARKRTNNK